MKSPEEIEVRLGEVIKSMKDAQEYQMTTRLNYGWDLDRERVLGGLITVENEKRKLLLWVLGQEKVGDK